MSLTLLAANCTPAILPVVALISLAVTLPPFAVKPAPSVISLPLTVPAFMLAPAPSVISLPVIVPDAVIFLPLTSPSVVKVTPLKVVAPIVAPLKLFVVIVAPLIVAPVTAPVTSKLAPLIAPVTVKLSPLIFLAAISPEIFSKPVTSKSLVVSLVTPVTIPVSVIPTAPIVADLAVSLPSAVMSPPLITV